MTKMIRACRVCACADLCAYARRECGGSGVRSGTIRDFGRSGKCLPSPYGAEWSCDYGYSERGGACLIITISHETAGSRRAEIVGECERGYRNSGEGCAEIELPAHAYLSEFSAGRGWDCERGFVADYASCVPVNIPENGYLNDRGDNWNVCAAIAVSDRLVRQSLCQPMRSYRA